jgi:hypothetical protein
LERNGRDGVGDALDVVGDCWGVTKAMGEEDGDGEFVRVVMEDELAQLHHGDYMSHSWGWIENNCLLHIFGFSLLDLLGRFWFLEAE